MSPRPIILIGMMYSGKSTVGRVLASSLERTFIDIDNEIEKASQLSIRDWFLIRGETAFREEEHKKLLHAVDSNPRSVIAAGGGAFEDPKSRIHCLENGWVVYLLARIETLAGRLADTTDRPLLDDSRKPPETVLVKLMEEREENYRKAHYSVAVEGRTAKEVAEIIAEASNKTNRR